MSSADLAGARGGNPHTGVGDVELDLHDVQLSADVRRARVAGSTPALAASWTSPEIVRKRGEQASASSSSDEHIAFTLLSDTFRIIIGAPRTPPPQ